MSCKCKYCSPEIAIQGTPIIVEVFKHSVHLEGMISEELSPPQDKESKKCMCISMPGSNTKLMTNHYVDPVKIVPF